MDGPLIMQQGNSGYLVSRGYDNKITFDKSGKDKGGSSHGILLRYDHRIWLPEL
jgi:hypothetical protein